MVCTGSGTAEVLMTRKGMTVFSLVMVLWHPLIAVARLMRVLLPCLIDVIRDVRANRVHELRGLLLDSKPIGWDCGKKGRSLYRLNHKALRVRLNLLLDG